MGYIRKTPAGTWRACWRDAAGRQPSKTFKTRREATTFLAQVETQTRAGTYVDPHAGRKVTFGTYASRWLDGRATELTTLARDRSYMQSHLISEWGDVPLSKIDHSSVQGWIRRLSDRLAPATVDKCRQLMSAVMKAAIRDRLIAVNPVEGVQLPKNRRRAGDQLTITIDQLTTQLLPAVPDRYRALVALAGGTGLRWGECVGLRWNAVTSGAVLVERVAIEVSGYVSAKPYPKSAAGRREVPLPPLVQQELARHRDVYGTGRYGEVFTNEARTPPRRTLFRSRVWRPSLVRAGLLGDVHQLDDARWLATWPTASGAETESTHAKYVQAVQMVAAKAHGGLRFHDLRHSNASWLITSGVPIADAQKVMGHESPQTLLGIYTHVQNGARDRIIGALAAFSLPLEPESEPTDEPKGK